MLEEVTEEAYDNIEETETSEEELGKDLEYSEYEEVEESKEFSILDLSEFIRKTELWYQFIHGELPLTDLIKEGQKLLARKRARRLSRQRRTRKEAKKSKTKASRRKGKSS